MMLIIIIVIIIIIIIIKLIIIIIRTNENKRMKETQHNMNKTGHQIGTHKVINMVIVSGPLNLLLPPVSLMGGPTYQIVGPD